MPQTVAEIEVRDGVVVTDLTDWDGDPEKVDADIDEWLTCANEPGVTGSVTVLSDDLRLTEGTQRRVAEEWSSLGEEAGHDRAAYVSEGLKAMAVAANVEFTGELETFDSIGAAVEWASG